jgi:hypothetical protein
MNTAEAFAVHNVGATLEYRCAMVETVVTRALEQAGTQLAAGNKSA